jgi:hypothetical protein
MHESRIVVDLPSAETDRRRGPIEWLRSLFGAQLELGSGREELTVGALWLVEGLVEAFAAVGIHDVTSFLVDQEVIYVDSQDVGHDLPMIVRAAEAAGVQGRKFREMRLVLAHRSEALHTVIDCKVKDDVLLGEAEMTIALSSRARLRNQREEASPYRASPTLRELDALTERIANELTSALAGARVTREAARRAGT